MIPLILWFGAGDRPKEAMLFLTALPLSASAAARCSRAIKSDPAFVAFREQVLSRIPETDTPKRAIAGD